MGCAGGTLPIDGGCLQLMPLSHNTPRVGEWRGGQHPPLPRLPPALLLLGGLGPPSPFCCIPLLVFLGKGGGGGHLTLCPRGQWCGRETRPAVHHSVVVAVFPLPGLVDALPSASHPAAGRWGGGVNKADGRGCSLSLHSLASLLSSVRRLCDQASEGALWGRPAPLIPLMPLCSSLSPAILSMGCYFLPQGRKPHSPGKPLFLGGSAARGAAAV